MKITNTDDPKAPLIVAGLFAVVGALQLFVYWDGFVAWVRICSMSYAEVSTTPFLPIWTSMRAVGGIVCLIGSLVWFSGYIRLRNAKKKGHDVAA